MEDVKRLQYRVPLSTAVRGRPLVQSVRVDGRMVAAEVVGIAERVLREEAQAGVGTPIYPGDLLCYESTFWGGHFNQDAVGISETPEWGWGDDSRDGAVGEGKDRVRTSENPHQSDRGNCEGRRTGGGSS